MGEIDGTLLVGHLENNHCKHMLRTTFFFTVHFRFRRIVLEWAGLYDQRTRQERAWQKGAVTLAAAMGSVDV